MIEPRDFPDEFFEQPDIAANEIYFNDCLNILYCMKTSSVDLFLQDTPFGVTQNKWDVKPDLQIMWKEWKRVAKPNCAFLFFATQPFASELIFSNMEMFKYDLIWYKPLCTGFLNANKMPLRNHEYILVFYKKPPTYNPQMGVGLRKMGMRKHDRNGTNYGKFATATAPKFFDDEGKRFPQSVIEFTNGDRTTENDHPTQKPIDLIRYLIKTYSNENEIVFDGYSGSGTTAAAAIMENRRYIVCENRKEYYDQSIERINILRSQTTLDLKAS